MLSRYLCSDSYAAPYFERIKESLEDSFPGGTTFIDVNSRLRYSVPALRKVFDRCTIYHQVRDPRAVVPSSYLRRGDGLVHSLPTASEDVRWLLDADKFEQVCWSWTDTTKRLLEQDSELLQFERLISDYDYLKERLLSPAGLNLSRADWKAKKDIRVNKTRSKLFRYLYARIKNKGFVKDEVPSYSEWSDARKKTFERICGEVRRQVGYD